MRQIAIAMLALVSATSASFAHYNMLLPDKPWANKDEKVAFTYQFGHPFEHELFDAPKPAALVLITPKGQKKPLDVDKTFSKIELPGSDGKKVSAWKFDFTPAERGDHTFVLKTPKIKIDENEFVEDTVRVVLHVQTQNGWEANTAAFDTDYEMRPYTRPYGLVAGMAFRGRFVQVYNGNLVGYKETIAFSGKPPPPESILHWQLADGATVEIEKYNAKPPKNLPPDELITFKAKTDVLGYFVATLPDPGWWAVTGIIRDTDKKATPPTVTNRRATMWIHVDEKK